MRTCKQLAQILRAVDTAWWRYGIRDRITTLLTAIKWPRAIVQVFATRFDPFYDAWPADMPARVRPTRQQALAWMWKRTCSAYDKPERLHGIGREWSIFITDIEREHRWSFGWVPSPDEEWSIIHGWMGGGGEDKDFRLLEGALRHACLTTKKEPDPWFSVSLITEESPVIWIDRLATIELWGQDGPQVGRRFHGYCTSGCPLDGAYEWRDSVK